MGFETRTYNNCYIFVYEKNPPTNKKNTKKRKKY